MTLPTSYPPGLCFLSYDKKNVKLEDHRGTHIMKPCVFESQVSNAEEIIEKRGNGSFLRYASSSQQQYEWFQQ